MRISQAVVIAGGSGTRLTSRGISTPKPLLKFDDSDLFELQVSKIKACGINSIHFLLGVGSEEIRMAVLGSKLISDFKVTFSIEPSPLGTGGALASSFDFLDEAFLLIYGDILFDTNLDTLIDSISNYDGALLTRPSDHMFDSDLIETDIDGLITNFARKPHNPDSRLRNRANTGIYAFRKKLVADLISKFGSNAFDLDREGIPFLLEVGNRLKATKALGFIRDVGTIDRIESTRQDWVNRVSPNSKVPAIFLDRDGVINRQKGHISKVEDFELLPGSIEAIVLLKKHGYKVLVVTNQPVLARGEVTWNGLEEIHAKLDKTLGDLGTFVDDYFVCPHYPESGFEGEVREWKIECECRKPKAGLLIQALKDHSIDLNRSWFCGDQLSDMQAADQAGVRFSGIGNAAFDWGKNPHFDDLLSFALWLVCKHDNLGQ